MIDPRIQLIKETLIDAFNPMRVDVIDESHLHVGHPGATPGKLHIAIIIESEALDGLSKLKQHRLIYQALGDFITHDLHAIRIDIK